MKFTAISNVISITNVFMISIALLSIRDDHEMVHSKRPIGNTWG